MHTLPLTRKDDRTDSSPLPAPAKEATGNEYRTILERARTRQLEQTGENLTRLAQTFDNAAQAIVARVRAIPDAAQRTGTPWLKAQLQLLVDIDGELTALKRDFGGLLDVSLLSTAQQVADREREVEKLVGAPSQPNLMPGLAHEVTLTNGTTASVSYGSLAKNAVDAVTNRYYADGLKLSDRLYTLDVQARKKIENAIVQGIANGTSARNMARQLDDDLMKAGAQNPRMRAMTIARTEINNAHREGSIRASVYPETNTLKPYISAIGWRLSASHKELDRCDLYAADDNGLGSGNYLPGDVPVSHPRCMCAVVDVLTAFPEQQFVRMAPDAANVPVSEVQRLAAREGDPVAARWLSARTELYPLLFGPK